MQFIQSSNITKIERTLSFRRFISFLNTPMRPFPAFERNADAARVGTIPAECGEVRRDNANQTHLHELPQTYLRGWGDMSRLPQ